MKQNQGNNELHKMPLLAKLHIHREAILFHDEASKNLNSQTGYELFFFRQYLTTRHTVENSVTLGSKPLGMHVTKVFLWLKMKNPSWKLSPQQQQKNHSTQCDS